MALTYQQAVQKVVDLAASKIGDAYNETPPYNIGPNSFDCQGLCYYVYGNAIGLWSGPGIGAVGSAAQFNNSTVKVPAGQPLRAGMQAFFYGGETFGPRPGHTGIVTGVFANGTYEMINAYDTQMGVIYTTFSTVPGSTQFMGYWGATDPISLLVPYTPPAPLEAPMLIEVTSQPSGQFTVGSWWEYGVGSTGRVLYPVADPKQVPTLKAFYGTFHSITGLRLAADVEALGIHVIFAN